MVRLKTLIEDIVCLFFQNLHTHACITNEKTISHKKTQNYVGSTFSKALRTEAVIFYNYLKNLKRKYYYTNLKHSLKNI